MSKLMNGNSLRGSLLVIFSSMFFGSYGIWSKFMSGSFGEFNQAWTRAVIILCFLIPFGVFNKRFKKVQQKDIIWFTVVSLLGGFNQAPYYYGFEHLTIGTSTLLFYLMLTVGSYIIGKLFFSEKLNSIKFFSLLLATIGLFIIYRFSLTPAQLLPALSSMIAGLMGAGFVVFSKKISSGYSEVQILSTVFFAMAIGNFILSTLLKEPLPVIGLGVPWIAQLGYAAAMVAANSFVIHGFRYLEPSVGGVIGLLEVIFAAFFGVVIFRDQFTQLSIIGGLLLVTAAGMPDIAKLMNKRKK